MPFEIGAQLYTIREHTKNAQDLRSSLIKVRDMGYRNVQLSSIGSSISPEAIRDILDETQLRAITTHIPFEEMQKDLSGVIDRHKLWGCTHPGVGSMPAAYRADYQGYERFAVEASKIAKELRDAGLTFIYHNHSFEFARFGGVLGMDILLQSSDPAFTFEIDTHWVQAGGASPAQWIRKVAGRMDIVHFKDMVIVQGDQGVKQNYAEVGRGNLAWDEIFAACEETGVSYAFVEQDDFYLQGDPFLSLEASCQFLQARGYR